MHHAHHAEAVGWRNGNRLWTKTGVYLRLWSYSHSLHARGALETRALGHACVRTGRPKREAFDVNELYCSSHPNGVRAAAMPFHSTRKKKKKRDEMLLRQLYPLGTTNAYFLRRSNSAQTPHGSDQKPSGSWAMCIDTILSHQ